MRKPIATIMVVLMTITMMLPANLVALADDPAGTNSQLPQESVESSAPQETQLPQESAAPQETPLPQESTAPQETPVAQEISEPQTSGSLTPLDETPETYAITIVSSPNGTLVADAEAAEQGATVTLTATADADCGLVPGSIKVRTDSQNAPRVVRGSGSVGDPYTFTMPNDSVTVTAEFVKYNKIIVTENIEHGRISTDVSEAIKNEIVTITVTPDDGYRLLFKQTGATKYNQAKSLTLLDTEGKAIKYRQSGSDWNYDPTGPYTWPIPDYDNLMNVDNKNLNIEAITYYFKMPECDVVLNAEFALAYNVTLDPEMVGGTLNLSGRTKATVGEMVSPYSTTAESGYKYVTNSVKVLDAQGVDISTDAELMNSYGFIMPAQDVVLAATFEKILIPDVNLSVSAVGDTEVTLEFTTHVDQGNYAIYRLEKDATQSVYGGGSYANDTKGTVRTATVSGLKNGVEYEFYLYSYTESVETARVTATPVGIPATAVKLTSNAVETAVGGEVVLYYAIEPATSKGGVTWESSDESILTVEQNGRIRALALGTATITATAITGDAFDECVITVKETLDKLAGGSMIVGDADATYDEDGGQVAVPFTVTVPTNKPQYRFTFGFSMNANSVYRINGISLKGTTLAASASTEVDDVKVQLGAVPYPLSGLYSAWATVTPKEGRFLVPGKTYEFVLDVEILSTATPLVTVGLNSSYTTFNYYDPDYDNRSWLERSQSGTIHATWVGASTEPSTSGSGTSMVYNLSTASDLLWYADKWNTDENFDFGATLYADIDLTNTTFAGIGTAAHPYSRSFNGNGYTVTYALTQSADGGAIGFIRYMSASIVSNLRTAGTLTVSGDGVKAGGIVGEASGTMYFSGNCVNNVNIEVTGEDGYVGGFAGYMDSAGTGYSTTFGSAVNNGAINAPKASYVGGIAGFVKCTLEFNETINNGAVTGSGYVGGIVGYMEYPVSGKRIGSNTNNGAVTSLGGTAVGGVAGAIAFGNVGGYWLRSSRADGNLNYGNVTGAARYVGGIVGYVNDVDAQFIVMNYNEGNVTSTYTGGGYVGGVVAYLTGSTGLTIVNNINKGIVSGSSGATLGGVIAAAENELDQTKCSDNYYTEQDGLSDAIGAVSAPASFLSLNGWAPNYSGSPDDDGSAEKPYKLANAFDMLWLASQVNGGTGNDGRPIRSAYVELSADIDLTEYPAYEGIGILGIGTPNFQGSFDGKDYTITLALDASAPGAKYDNAALFPQCSGATIKNLTIKGSAQSKPGAGFAAGVAIGTGGTLFENVTNYADITGWSAAAGIAIGYYNGPDRLVNIKNYGTIVSGGNAAGVVVYLGGQCVISRCENYGDVTAGGTAAGIIGRIDGGSKSNSGTPSYYITDCVNNGAITSLSSVVHDEYPWRDSTGNTAAGIVGRITGAIVDLHNCTNNGAIQTAGNSAGGIVGSGMGEWNIGAGETSQMTDIRITNSTNNGNVASNYNGDDPSYLQNIGIGGIIGQTGEYDWTTGNPGGTQGLTVVGNVNNGTISGPEGANVGSIVGITDIGGNSSGGTVRIEDNWSSTEVIGGGKVWENPRYQAPEAGLYDPNTHAVIDGRLVEKNPQPNNPNPNQNTPSTTGTTSVVDPSATVVVADTVSPSTILPSDGTATTPVRPQTTPNTTPIDPADTPTTDSTPAPARTLTFFEVVVETVQNNPIIVVLIVVAAGVLAMLGGLWRYRKTRRE
jgi:hypothetical protein